MHTEQDHQWMGLAIQQAKLAEDMGEVPVGAIVVSGGKLISEAYNSPITLNDPTAHAEVLALRSASSALENYRLTGCELFVTIEPCIMCAGALIHSRIDRIVFGAYEPKAGVACSHLSVFEQNFVNHKVKVDGGLREEECANLMQSFFKKRRSQ